MPDRIQLRRTKGWKLPANAVNVARPTFWGNPYRVDQRPEKWWSDRPWNRHAAVECYALMLASGWRLKRYPGHNIVERAMVELEGKDLACYCRLDQPCHADVLLAYANPGIELPVL